MHVYDYTPEPETKKFLEENREDAAKEWVGLFNYPPTLTRNSHQMVMSNRENYFPHSGCVGGIDYSPRTLSEPVEKFMGGLFAPSVKNTTFFKNEKVLRQYNVYLDWALSAGPQSSIFLENSYDETIEGRDFSYLTFHGDAPGNVVGMAIISLRLWNGSHRLSGWHSLVNIGIDPWIALYLCHSLNIIEDEGDRLLVKEGLNRADGHSTFASVTDFNGYKSGVINKPNKYFSRHAKASYNGSFKIWDRAEEKYEFSCEKLCSEGILYPTVEAVVKDTFIFSAYDTSKVFTLDRNSVVELNKGLDNRVKRKSSEWLEKGLVNA